MKNKLFIGILAVFICGVLAITIPKKASANTLQVENVTGYLNGDTTTQEQLLNMKNNEYIDVTMFINNAVFKGPDITTEITEIEYSYWRIDDILCITGINVHYKISQTNLPSNYVEAYWPIYYDYELINIANLNDKESNGFFNYDYSPVISILVGHYGNYLGSTGNISHYEIENEIEIVLNNPNVDSDLTFVYYTDFDFVGNPLEQSLDSVPAYYDFVPNLLLYAKMITEGTIELEYTFPVYLDEDVNFLDYLKTSTTEFLETDLIGDLSLGDLLLFVVSIGLLVFLLRFFAGG